MPHIFRAEAERYFEHSQKAFCEAGFDGVLIRSMEEIGYLKEHGPEIPWVFDYGMSVSYTHLAEGTWRRADIRLYEGPAEKW